MPAPPGRQARAIDGTRAATHARGVTTASTRPHRDGPAVEAGPFDKAAYLFALLGLYVMTSSLFFYGFWSKGVKGDFTIPPPLEEQFDKTIIGTIPGAEASWVIVTLLEGAIFLLLAASVATLEFRPSRRKPLLLTALSLALLVFGLLSFGENATAQAEGVASLYGYFGATVILMIFVRLLPPYSSTRWLG